MKIYVASSWRNVHYDHVTKLLQSAGHEIMDWKNSPEAFKWQDIDENWRKWTPEQYRTILRDDSKAFNGFRNDLGMMQTADACVLLLPSGRSAHIEAGWFCGANKPVFVYVKPEPNGSIEPELMYRLASGVVIDDYELLARLRTWTQYAPTVHRTNTPRLRTSLSDDEA